MIESKIFSGNNIEIPNKEEYSDYVLLSERQYCKLYRATKLGKQYIIKTTKDNSERQLAMLRREYELSIECTHPHIVHIYSYENISSLGEAIVMEYVEGRTLNHYLAEKPAKQSLNQIFEELLSALSYLHKRGIVHNDIKPENILITHTDNTLKLIDFGLADNDAQYAIRQLGCTPAYASPELLSQQSNIDARSDIYSAGIVMHQIFGRKHNRIISKCTKQNPNERYTDITALQIAWKNRNRGIKILLAIITLVIILLPSSILIKKQVTENQKQEAKQQQINAYEKEVYALYLQSLDSIQNHAIYFEFATDIFKRHGVKLADIQKHYDPLIILEASRLPLIQDHITHLAEEYQKLPLLYFSNISEEEKQYYKTLQNQGKPYQSYK